MFAGTPPLVKSGEFYGEKEGEKMPSFLVHGTLVERVELEEMGFKFLSSIGSLLYFENRERKRVLWDSNTKQIDTGPNEWITGPGGYWDCKAKKEE